MRSFARGDAARFDRWIADGVSPDAAREEVFQAMLETHKPFSRASTVEMGADSGDRFRRALTAGMLQRAGYFRAAEWKGVTPEPRTLREIARECVRRQGIPLPGDDTRLLRAASHSTSDFANILLDTLHKAVALSFAEQPSTWARWARPVTASDFRPMSRLILSEAPNLFAIGQQSPVIEGTFNDAARATLAPTTFARRFGISREAFINDDQNIFAQVPQLFGASAARLIDDLVYALLVSQSGTGPNMHDGVAMFHTNHANLGTTGALSLTTLAEARKLMRLQKGSGPNTAILNLTPSVLLTPAALETAAEQLLSSLVVPTKAADLSVGFVRNLELVTEARLDATSATAFYVLAGPANPAIEVAFLNGQRTPQIEQINVSQSVALSGILGFEWVAWIDVGVAALDWRGAVRNAGA
jgi:hypothetical protein